MTRAAGAPVWVRGIERLSGWAANAAAVCTVLMALHVITDVVGRSVFSRPLPATLEFVGLGWMPLIVFLALAQAQRVGEHLRVTLFVERLSATARRIADLSALLIVGIILALALIYAGRTGIHAVEIGEIKAAIFEFPVWPFRLVAVAGLALLLTQTAASLWHVLAGEHIGDAVEAELATVAEATEPPGRTEDADLHHH